MSVSVTFIFKQDGVSSKSAYSLIIQQTAECHHQLLECTTTYKSNQIHIITVSGCN